MGILFFASYLTKLVLVPKRNEGMPSPTLRVESLYRVYYKKQRITETEAWANYYHYLEITVLVPKLRFVVPCSLFRGEPTRSVGENIPSLRLGTRTRIDGEVF